MFFFWCCCERPPSNLNITHDITPVLPATDEDPYVHSLESPDADFCPQPSAEEREAEKVRLQAAIIAFVKKAVKGCPCAYLNEGATERTLATYTLDQNFEELAVLSSQDPSRREVVCRVAAIQEIYSPAQDGRDCFPPDVLALLSPEELELLLMVVYRGGPDKTLRFCMLEDSKASRDVFLECMRVLCIYAQSRKP